MKLSLKIFCGFGVELKVFCPGRAKRRTNFDFDCGNNFVHREERRGTGLRTKKIKRRKGEYYVHLKEGRGEE